MAGMGGETGTDRPGSYGRCHIPRRYYQVVSPGFVGLHERTGMTRISEHEEWDALHESGFYSFGGRCIIGMLRVAITVHKQLSFEMNFEKS